MLPLFLVATALVACGGSKHPTATLEIDGHAITAELAIDNPSRMEGLMHRSTMAENHGMLFIYPDYRPRSFWMKDTRIPLSIAFADESGTIVKIADMEPFDTEQTKSLYPAKYALEMNKGWFDARGIEKGATIAGIPSGLTIE